MTAAPAARRRSKKSILLWVAVIGLGLLVVGFIAAKLAIDSYLRSDRFRAFVAQKTGQSIKSEVEMLPFRFTGSSIYCEGLKARGSTAAAFSGLDVDQIRIDVSARRFFEHVWQIDQVEVQHFQLDLDGPRITLPELFAAKEEAERKEKPDSSGFLPNRVEIAEARVQNGGVNWKDGGLSGTSVEVVQKDGGWNIAGHGGTLRQAGLPTVDVDSLRLLYRQPSLFIQSAEFRQGESGTISASGEVKFDERLDVQAKLDHISITPLLPDDWRVRFGGDLAGDIRAQGTLPAPAGAAPKINGSLNLANGHLEALPVLDRIALFTGAAQYRHLTLSKVSGDFQYDAGRLGVTNFVLESVSLIRIEGAFTVENNQIDGNFLVGVTPTSLQWLPGSQERVFTVSRNGYLWTPMHLTGPVSSPSEDLSQRLIAAAAGSPLEAAAGIVHSLLDVVNGDQKKDAGNPANPAHPGSPSSTVQKTIDDLRDAATGLLFGK